MLSVGYFSWARFSGGGHGRGRIVEAKKSWSWKVINVCTKAAPCKRCWMIHAWFIGVPMLTTAGARVRRAKESHCWRVAWNATPASNGTFNLLWCVYSTLRCLFWVYQVEPKVCFTHKAMCVIVLNTWQLKLHFYLLISFRFSRCLWEFQGTMTVDDKCSFACFNKSWELQDGARHCLSEGYWAVDLDRHCII